jgi:hypothetical protein
LASRRGPIGRRAMPANHFVLNSPLTKSGFVDSV